MPSLHILVCAGNSKTDVHTVTAYWVANIEGTHFVFSSAAKPSWYCIQGKDLCYLVIWMALLPSHLFLPHCTLPSHEIWSSTLNLGSSLPLSSLPARKRHVPCFVPHFSYFLVIHPLRTFLLPRYLLLSELSQEFSEDGCTWLCHTWFGERQAADASFLCQSAGFSALQRVADVSKDWPFDNREEMCAFRARGLSIKFSC